jgi:hypothetical protein
MSGNLASRPTMRPKAIGLVQLVTVLILAGLIAGGAIVWLGSPKSLPLLVIAWLTCTVSFSVGHWLGDWPAGDDFLMVRTILGLAVRAAPPIALVLVASRIWPDLAGRPFVLFVILIYLVGLATEVGLNVSRFRAPGPGQSLSV